ncbi:hypothetical protein MARPO_0607s0001, partial [Marchantia polymorpha]
MCDASLLTRTAKKTPNLQSIKSKATQPERFSTKSELNSSLSVDAPTSNKSTPPKPPSTTTTPLPLSPTSDVNTRASVSTSPAKGSSSAESVRGTAKPRNKPTTKSVNMSSSKSAHVVDAPSKTRSSQSKVPSSSSPSTPVPSSSLDMHPRAAITIPPSMAPSHMSSKGQTKPPGKSATKSGTVSSPELPESVEGPPKVESSQRELSLQVLPLPSSTSDLDPRGLLSMPSSKKTTTPESIKVKARVLERSGSQSRLPSSTGDSVLPQTYTDRSCSVFSSNPSTSQKQSRTRSSQPELKSSSPPTLPVSSSSLKIGKTGSLSTLSTKKTIIPLPVQGKIKVQERSTSKARQAQNLPTLPISFSKPTVSSAPTSIRTKPSSEVTNDKLNTPKSYSGQSRTGSIVKRPTRREAKLRSNSTQLELPSIIIEQRSSDESSTEMSTTSSSITSQQEPSLLSFPGSDPVIRISKSTPPTNKSWSNVAPQEKTEVTKSYESKSGASTTFLTSPVSTAPFRKGPSQPVFPPLPPLLMFQIISKPTPQPLLVHSLSPNLLIVCNAVQ